MEVPFLEVRRSLLAGLGPAGQCILQPSNSKFSINIPVQLSTTKSSHARIDSYAKVIVRCIWQSLLKFMKTKYQLPNSDMR